jgi:hypothetical protein
MIVMALCAVLCGADTWVDVAEWSEDNDAQLKRYRVLTHGTPSHDTFDWVFRILDARPFKAGFRQLTGGVVGGGYRIPLHTTHIALIDPFDEIPDALKAKPKRLDTGFAVTSTRSSRVGAARLVSSRHSMGLTPSGAPVSLAIKQVTDRRPPWPSARLTGGAS